MYLLIQIEYLLIGLFFTNMFSITEYTQLTIIYMCLFYPWISRLVMTKEISYGEETQNVSSICFFFFLKRGYQQNCCFHRCTSFWKTHNNCIFFINCFTLLKKKLCLNKITVGKKKSFTLLNVLLQILYA